VKRILKYLKGTADYGLYYSTAQSDHLKAFSDADYAGDVNTRKSITGYVLKLGESTVAWSSQKQKSVALSTTEAEYMAASQTVKEIIWVKSLLNSFALFQNLSTTLYLDNKNAEKLIRNPEFHQRSKHIDVRYHFVRDAYRTNEFTLEHIPSRDQQADLMTKPLTKAILETQKRMLNIISSKECETMNS